MTEREFDEIYAVDSGPILSPLSGSCLSLSLSWQLFPLGRLIYRIGIMPSSVSRVAALIFAILSCTDALDGYLAAKQGRGNELRKVHRSLGRQDLGGGGAIGAYRTSGSSFMGCVAHNRS